MAENKVKVLFVCSGNVYRSVVAEYCLRNFLRKKNVKNISVKSAGITAKPQLVDDQTLKFLKLKGIDASKHKQIKLSKEMINNFDLIIAMHKEHQDFIQNNFGVYVPLFNEIALGKSTSIEDVGEAHADDSEYVKNHTKNTVEHIYKNTEKIFNYIRMSNFLFVDFMKGHREQRDGYPFKPLYESKHSIAFMSIDIPNKEDAHVLVVPKTRFKAFEDIPPEIQHDLVESISIVGKAIKKNHNGYNVLLNNGWSAGQRIFHTHFHVIPRNEKDGIKIEVWKNKKLNKTQFIKLNEQIRENIKEVVNGA